PGVLTLSEALTGTAGPLNTDNTFTVRTRATDNYFNTAPYAGAVSVGTPVDLTDLEPAAGAFAAGIADFTIDPVQANVAYLVPTASALVNNNSAFFKISPP